MTEYIMLQLVAYSQNQQKKYDKFINKTFKMDDHIVIGKPIDLIFEKDKIRVKVNEVKKDKYTNVEKKYILDTASFTCLIQLKESFNNTER